MRLTTLAAQVGALHDDIVSESRSVFRPVPTIVLASALALWASCAGMLGFGRTQSCDSLAGIGAACTLLPFAAALIAAKLRKRVTAVLLASIALGIALGAAQSYSLHTQAQAAQRQDECAFTVSALEDSRTGAYGCTCTATALDGPFTGAHLLMQLPNDAHILCGENLFVQGKVSALDAADDEFNWSRGCTVRLKCSDTHPVESAGPVEALRAVRKEAIGALAGDDFASGLLQAVVCGYRESIRGSAEYESFKTCGVAHLIAVSGAHVVIVTGLIAQVLRMARFPRKASVAILVCVMASYLVMSGMPVSAVRATVMSAIGISSLFAQRRPSTVNALGLSIFAILAHDPQAALSVSFALSALSTLGIALFAPLAASWLSALPPSLRTSIVEPLSLTVSAALASQLYACSLFSKLPLASPVANIVVSPLFPIVCASGLLAALLALTPLPVSGPVLGFAHATAHLLGEIVGVVSQMPLSSVPFTIGSFESLALSFAIMALLWVSWPCTFAQVLKTAVLCTLSVVVVVMPAFGAQDRIVMLDVGQGDSFLVQSCGKSMLIDTGNQDAKLLRGLGGLWTHHIDAVVVTHGDDDHCGSLDELARSFDVETVVLCAQTFTCTCDSCRKLVKSAQSTARNVAQLSYGGTVRFGNFTARMVWPQSFSDSGGNADSLCLLIEYDGNADGVADARALFTGDAESEQLEAMLASGEIGSVDILKVGHHGSRKSLSGSQAKTLHPKVSLIGVGKNNRYGHPAPETVEALHSAGSVVYRSDIDGQVIVSLHPGSMSVTSER